MHDLRGTLPYMAPEMIMDHTHVTGERQGAAAAAAAKEKERMPLCAAASDGSGQATAGRQSADSCCGKPGSPLPAPLLPGPPLPAPAAEKADVWSLGVVFWEMLTLEVPFADMPPAQLIGGASPTLLACGPHLRCCARHSARPPLLTPVLHLLIPPLLLQPWA